jgi:hypothetical protein
LKPPVAIQQELMLYPGVLLTMRKVMTVTAALHWTRQTAASGGR